MKRGIVSKSAAERFVISSARVMPTTGIVIGRRLFPVMLIRFERCFNE